MPTLREAWLRLLALSRKRALDREFDDELAAHIELATQDHLRRGLSLEEARRRALIAFGGIELSKELHRDSRGLPWLDGMLQDIRYALRSLRRTPGVTLTAIAMLTLGIGINAAVFTVTNAALFKGFSLVKRNDRILYIRSSGPGYPPFVSYPDFVDWRAQARSFQGIGAANAVRVTLNDGGFSESYETTEVTPNTFQLLGQKPVLGRDFAPSDEIPGAAAVAILSYGLWDRRYGKDPSVIGRTVRIDGIPATLIGVMPRGFSFPRIQDLWMPLVPTSALRKREARGLAWAFGRLTAGATLDSAQAEMETIGARLARAYPSTNRGLVPSAKSYREFFVGSEATRLYELLWGAVTFVLLIACANLADLLLARAVGRSREISVRVALGAGRWRIVRQFLIESLMLSIAGGFLGWSVARWIVRAYRWSVQAPAYFDQARDYAMDYRVIGYLVAISAGAGLLFGMAPALRLLQSDGITDLKAGGRGLSGRGGRVFDILLAGEMALAIVLLAGAGVMIRSFLKIYDADLGFHTSYILTAYLELPDARYSSPETRISFYNRLTTRLNAIPGVESTAIADWFPTWGASRFPYEVEAAQFPGEGEGAELRPMLSAVVIGPDYFRTLGASVLSGRDFNAADGTSALPVVLVNERFAREHWPGENPLGKRLRLFANPADGGAPDAWRMVVGVVSNIIQTDFSRQEFRPLVYLPYRQTPHSGMNVLVRTRVPPVNLATVFRREVQAIDPGLPMFGPYTLTERLRANYWSNGLYGGLFVIFALMAVLLAAVGLYAVSAHSVRQRAQEIGIRVAVGATAPQIRKLVLWQGALPAGVGIAVGLVLSLIANRFLKAQLVGVSPADPVALSTASVILLAAALLGCWIPARRATRMDPMEVLRHD